MHEPSEFFEHEILLRDRNAFSEFNRSTPSEAKCRSLAKRLSASRETLKARRAHQLSFNYPQLLPVVGALETLTQSIRDHQVTVICSGTGSGKSTQVPKLCLQMELGLLGQIGHTQPRRLAARSVAQRIASETRSKFGEVVGCQVRFEKTVADHSRLKVMTDGILLEEIRNDRLLLQYDVLIIDEVHERSSNIDFVLGYIAKILPQRPDLKVILMSATVDNQAFLNLFEANAIDIPGKQFPIELEYRPYDPKEQTELEAVDAALRSLQASEDVLVFFPGEREINDAIRYLGGRGFGNTEFLPLFSRLNPRDQAKVFESAAYRKVILATNVAETSITIPGIRHVVDTGLARVSRYNPRSKLLELPVTEISQAAAKQRAGRCGREAPGRCIRLYGEENFKLREAYTLPEIQRTNLASSILRCEHLRLGNLEEFPLPDPPSIRLIRDGVNLLKEVAALDAEGKITSIGKQLARLSVDPRLGRFLVAAAEAGQLQYAMTIVAALSAGDCRIRPAEAREAADEMHEEFNHKDSDLLFFTNLWHHLEKSISGLGTNQRRKYCASKFLSWRRIQQWQNLRAQLARQSKALKLKDDKTELNYKRLHTAFLVGFASLIGCKKANGEYLGARDVTFRIHPRSVLIKRRPKFIACLEMYETTARYAQIVAKIDPAWVQRASPHLIKRSYSKSHWDSQRGSAVAFETQRLFGIKLGVDRKVSYVKIDPQRSRELFITHGLVNNEFGKTCELIEYNDRYVKELCGIEQKLRRSIAPDEHELYRHYAARIPKEIFTRKAFLVWQTGNPTSARNLKLKDNEETKRLYQNTISDFPDCLVVNRLEFDVNYLFDPSNTADGMTITVHKALLARLDDEAFEKLCPGMLKQKLTLFAKALPKNSRKKISPIADFVEELLDKMTDEGLGNIIARCYLEKTGEALDTGVLKKLSLPTNLIAHVKVVDPTSENCDGQHEVHADARFYSSLQEAKSKEGYLADKPTELSVETTHYTSWSFGELPLKTITEIGKNSISDYPALVDDGSGVRISSFRSQRRASQIHLHGVARLASIARVSKSSKRTSLARFSERDILLMCASVGITMQDLSELHKAAFAILLDEEKLPRSKQQFVKFLTAASAEAEALIEQMSVAIAELIPRAYRIKTTHERDIINRWPGPAAQITLHLTELLNGEMLSFMRPQGISSMSRYLSGIERRIERLQLDPRKDEAKMTLVAEPLRLWRELRSSPGGHLSESLELRYAIEELVLSQFAPELALRQKIGIKQILQKLNEQISVAKNGT